MAKCGLCGRSCEKVREVLRNGPNGFRRYKVCERCDPTPPLTPPQLEKQHLERGELQASAQGG